MSRPPKIQSQIADDTLWRVWFKEPYGFWTNSGHYRTRKDADLAIAAFQRRGYETKPEYLGRAIGFDNRRPRGL